MESKGVDFERIVSQDDADKNHFDLLIYISSKTIQLSW